jgi:DNA topoisomerase-1
MTRLENKLVKIQENPKEAAKIVGLRYFINTKRGFFRQGNLPHFYYTDAENVKIIDAELLQRFKSLVIPPAWQDVWISPYTNGHLQVTGIDGKGRKQYRYHTEWNKIRNQSKFYKLRKFAKALPDLRKQLDKDLSRKGLPYEKVVALVITLIENTNIRIGNANYAKLYGSFGLTTLRDRHVYKEKGMLYFEFIGKKGIKHKISLKNKRLARLVQRCKDIPGQELFQYYDNDGKHLTIGSADVNSYIKKYTNEEFTAKDLRCWSGTIHAFCKFLELEKPENPSQSNKKIIEVLDYVAAQLGNTRTVCKKYYVHPTVIASFEKGSLWQYHPKPSSKIKKHLKAEEMALLRLFKSEKIALALA